MRAVMFELQIIDDISSKIRKLKRNISLLLLLSSAAIFIMMLSLIFNFPTAVYSSKYIGKCSNSAETDTLKQKEKLYLCSVESAEQKAAEIIKDSANGLLNENGRAVDESEFNTDPEFYAYNGQEPPKLTIKAVIRISGKISACVDIDGVAEGIIMMPGMSFLTYGKIIAINDKSIEWQWRGKWYKTGF